MQPFLLPLSQEHITLTERLLGEALGGSIRLGTGELLQDGIRTLVSRFPVLDGPAQMPVSVIVKHVKSTEKAPYEPQRATMPAWTFFNEWASLQFLNTIAEGSFGPRFYAGDAARGMLIIEDLGQGSSLEQSLMGNDPAAAASALIEFATIHGRLHAATIGRQDEFKQMRESLGPSMLEDGYQIYEWIAPTLYRAADLLGITPEGGVEQEIVALKASLLHPEPFLSFIQGDSCPDNCLFTGSALQIVDFEGGMFDHALKEGVYGRMHFPTCRCVYRMPEPLPQQMEVAYRAELVKGFPEARDDKLFSRAVTEACVYWMIWWFQMAPLSHILEHDRRIVAATVRQRYLLRSNIVAQTTREAGHMEAIGATIGAMATKMLALWPDTEAMPAYPAFRT
jgi:hypothetical protein